MDSKTWAFLRSYIPDYIVGILWILPVLVAFTTEARVATIASAIKMAKMALGPVTVTEFVIGFITVIAGVVVPYCAAKLIMPSSYLVTNFLFGLHQRVWRKNRAIDDEIEGVAAGAWTLPANVSLSDKTKIMLLRSRNGRAAEDLSVSLDALVFKGHVLLPTALLLSCVLWRIGFTAGLAAGIGAIVFLVSDFAANVDAATWRRRLHIAIVALGSDGA
jgi:hypothetical protein